MAFTQTTVLTKKFWDVFIYQAGDASWKSDPTWGTQVGELDGDASLKASAGDSVKLASGIDAQISENGEATFTLLGSNATAAAWAANYGHLKDIINKPCNIMFIPTGAANKATENVKLSGMYIFPELNIQANQLSKIIITAKREFGPGTAVSLNQANNQ